MEGKIHILKASGRLSKFEAPIKQTLTDTLKDLREILPLPDFDVVVEDNPFFAQPGIGVGGFTGSSHLINIYTDPGLKDYQEKIDFYMFHLRSTFSHESHHAVRWLNPGYGETLFESIVSEGLATHFQIEFMGPKVEEFFSKLHQDQIGRLLNLAQKQFDDSNFNYNDWQGGNEKKKIPKSAIYSLGYHVIGKYLKEHPDQKASTLYNVKAEVFR